MKSKSEKNEKERLVLAINPVVGHDLHREAEAIAGLEEYLSKALGVEVEIGLRENYQETLRGMETGEIDAARLGQYAFAVAQARFGAKALVNAIEIQAPDEAAPAPYRSVIFTRADSGLTNLVELKGHEFGFVDRNSTTGYLVPTFLLEQAGLDPARDLKPRFLLSHEAVVAAVQRGELLAGAVMQGEFSFLTQKSSGADFRVLATSPLLSRGPVAVRPGLPYHLERKLLAALVQLHQAKPPGAELIIPRTQRFTPANQREMTLKTVAELAGVSYGTVSRAINGRDRIAPATTARILRLVEELGYRPNANARSLHKARGDLVGLLLPGLNFPGLDAIISGLQKALAETQMQLVVCPVGQNSVEALPRQKSYFELLYDNRLEGLVLTQWNATGAEALELAQSGRPIVLLEQELLTEGFSAAWNWLRAQGHRRVALVAGPNSLLEPNISRHIFSQVAGPDFEFVTGPDQLEPGLLEKPGAPTAFLCTGQLEALELHERFSRQNNEIMVLGFGDSSLAKWAKLPAVAFDGEEVGARVAQRLLKMSGMTGPAPKQPLKFWIEINS
jgi:phosphonate transport system substrate-binding protein